MRKLVAALLMLVLIAGQALALTGSASAMAMPDGFPAASVNSADETAVPVRKRVCWRKTLTAVHGDFKPVLPQPCGADVKNTCEVRLEPWPVTRRAHGPLPIPSLTGSEGSGLFRPPIA